VSRASPTAILRIMYIMSNLLLPGWPLEYALRPTAPQPWPRSFASIPSPSHSATN
jgi:hypothetical protein